MADLVDLKNVVQHILDGNINKSLCRVCLQPLGGIFENIFTKIIKEGVEFSVAEVLQTLCGMQLHEADDYFVCEQCFIIVCTAYRLYTLCQRSNEILDFYIDNLNENIDVFDQSDAQDSLCISLPDMEPNMQNINVEEMVMFLYKPIQIAIEDEIPHLEVPKSLLKTEKARQEEKINNDRVTIVVKKEDSIPKVYKVKGRQEDSIIKTEKFKDVTKIRRKRDPMEYTQCSKCDVRYRFLAKLKEHMRLHHGIDLQICKVCRETFENEEEFNEHLKTHNIHRCDKCNAMFKKRETIIAHLKWHSAMENLLQKDGVYVCETCGVVLADEEEMRDHYDKKHDKKYTCYYCGRLYRSEVSLDLHIKKHLHVKKPEEKITGGEKDNSIKKSNKTSSCTKTTSNKRYECVECNGKSFVDERALKWHRMLHRNERPYKCDECGRGFISVNRRNQHALCAHTAPTKRCPLCPALFHLRSMVNTHIKKVHIKAHKRRYKTNKHQTNVYWRTEPVPIQDLSVEVQNELLEMKTSQEAEDEDMI